MSTFVTNTPLSQLRPIGSEGERSFARVSALVERHLSERHASILADPVPVRDGSGIDWYTDRDGEIVRLPDLSASDAATVREVLSSILADMRNTAAQLDESGNGKHHSAAVALNNAATFPGEDYVYALRDGAELLPIVVAWSYEAHDPAVSHAFNISAFGPGKRPRIVARDGELQSAPLSTPVASHVSRTQPVEKHDVASELIDQQRQSSHRGTNWNWLLPLLPATLCMLLLGVIVALLLPACGLRTPFGTVTFGFPAGHGCTSVAAAALQSPGDGLADLERELVVVQQEYQRQRLSCIVADLQTQPRAEEQMPASEEAFDERIGQRGEAQVSLVWESRDDLDLWLECPNGQRIFFGQRQGCGGVLDVDQNAGGGVRDNPAENITFAEGVEPGGGYRIGVKFYERRSGFGPVPFRVRIRNESGARVVEGSVSNVGENVIIGDMSN